MKNSTSSLKENQPFRKNIIALFIATVLALFLICLFNLIGSLITYVTTVSGFALFGWFVGSVVSIYLLVSGLLKDTLSFLIEFAKNFGNAIADGYYDTPTTAV